jgi:hypothetical protein
MRHVCVFFCGIYLLVAPLLAASEEAQINPPLPPIRCNMNCRNEGAITTIPAKSDPALDLGKHRLIVLTDMGGDNDDSQSIVRLLLYSNEIDVEGLIATTPTFMSDRTNPWLIELAVNAYAKVRRISSSTTRNTRRGNI